VESLGLALPGKSELLHSVIGGGICFVVAFLVSGVLPGGVVQSLMSLGIAGVISFQDEFILATNVILFGAAYLPSGFIGGLYTGYQTEENLKITLAISGVLGFVILTVLLFFLGQVSPANLDLVGRLILPFAGNVLGAYLGGYAMNWPSGEEEESFGKVSVEV